jgi:hypothetical protein
MWDQVLFVFPVKFMFRNYLKFFNIFL